MTKRTDTYNFFILKSYLFKDAFVFSNWDNDYMVEMPTESGRKNFK